MSIDDICFVCISFRNYQFKKSDAFVGFQKDTPASVVFQATYYLRSACVAWREGPIAIDGKWHEIMKWSKLSAEEIQIEEEGDQKAWEDAVRSYI